MRCCGQADGLLRIQTIERVRDETKKEEEINLLNRGFTLDLVGWQSSYQRRRGREQSDFLSFWLIFEFFAARRSELLERYLLSYPVGRANGRMGGWKRFWSQINNFKKR